MLRKNVPDEVTDERAADLLVERLPNYCHECGAEIVIAGGRLDPEMGWYEHIDPVLMCSRGCWRDRFTAGIDQDEGQRFREAPGAKSLDEELGHVTGYCDIHKMLMQPTKDLQLTVEGDMLVPVRQYKCPECDRETTVAVTSRRDD